MVKGPNVPHLDRVLEETEIALKGSNPRDVYYALLDLISKASFNKDSYVDIHEEGTSEDDSHITQSHTIINLHITLVESLMWSIHSPISHILRKHNVIKPESSYKTEIQKSIKVLQSELETKKDSKTQHTRKTHTRLDTPHDTVMDQLMTEAEAMIASRRAKLKDMKAIAMSTSKWRDTQSSRLQKQRQQTVKMQRHLTKTLLQGVSKFWRVAGAIAYKRHQQTLRTQLARIKIARQKAWVRRTYEYSSRLAKRLEGVSKGVSKGVSDESSVSSDGWSDQESEDRDMEEAMSSEDNESGEDEVALLKRDNELEIGDVLQSLKGEGCVDGGVKTEGVGLSTVEGEGSARVKEDEGSNHPVEEDTSDTHPPHPSPDTPPIKQDSKSSIVKRRKRRNSRLEQSLARKRQRLLEGKFSDDSDASEGLKPLAPVQSTESSSHKGGSHRQDTPHDTPKEAQEMSSESIPEPKRKRRRKETPRPTRPPRPRQPARPTHLTQPTHPPSDYTLLKAVLREYQKDGVDWLMTLHDCDINGILADEMGLGKTVQTIALLARLAIERGIWGPHLIVVPTSVVLNWEVEFRKFAPGFKVITYIGSKKERDKKRQGWGRAHAFNVCITSYSVAITDAVSLKRFTWYYMVMDEAQNLKNPQSARWQTLLQYASVFRLLLTGTPIQNNLMELWSLMYFLMPEVFGSASEWKELFADPLTSAIERSQVEHETSMIRHLYSLLRPFLLRRLKKDVEDQLPSKIEFVLQCELSRRQKILYDEIILQNQRNSTFETGEYLTLMNTLMQLRKICNHPNLLDDRWVDSPVADDRLQLKVAVPKMLFLNPVQPADHNSQHQIYSILRHAMRGNRGCDNEAVRLSACLPHTRDLTKEEASELRTEGVIEVPSQLQGKLRHLIDCDDINTRIKSYYKARERLHRQSTADKPLEDILANHAYYQEKRRVTQCTSHKQSLRTPLRRIWETSVIQTVSSDLVTLIHDWIKERSDECDMELVHEKRHILCQSSNDFNTKNENRVFVSGPPSPYVHRNWVDIFPDLRRSVSPRFQFLVQPRVLGRGPDVSVCGSGGELLRLGIINQWESETGQLMRESYSHELWSWLNNSQVILPDAKALEFDSGKLMVLGRLLREKKAQGLKCVIFTQMSKMLDILEAFININGYSYVRLDGGTKAERRQMVVDAFNNDPRIFLFIASTRSGGVGINLTGGSVVIFYDTDWNPAMDRQAMDRCHRLGQTQDVHIYRLINKATVEENIWRKQLQKRQLDDIVVDQGKFVADLFFTQGDVRDILFTVDSTTDLYATRVLHDRPAACDIVLKELARQNLKDTSPATTQQSFSKVMAQVEDAEDKLAFEQSAQELAQDFMQFDEEFADGSTMERGGSVTEDILPQDTLPIVWYGVRYVETVSVTRAMEAETNLVKTKSRTSHEND
eukprot:Blabericola_migrator_1__11320@NODE_668_length_6963_cov_352_794519_g487_i0_p1_GENE_NODE_668_length_6963_cov_352_794519_g487_i0NODE_668_length_6963_cov_352_794519_g487_i0_p1_ORF_typecomplete_len1422_score370_46SNF2_N/PF00176_23/2_5e80Helicase_C/PF00271_31/8_8e03Helicase_C/PF00271_31/8_1e19ResIII/PF04851_15/1_9e13HDA23/PF11496_8/5_1e03HDA23/PF11496_8/0_02HDA23/PF11496_8/3_4e07PBP3/PF18056_1/0_12DUF1515/PF07439_11/0_19DUF1515/PF07439_11/1_5e04_NODE_668_length_6963_cov_352_794519_g487_i0384303